MCPKSNNLTRDRRGEDTDRRRPRPGEVRDESDAARAEESLEPPEAARGKEGFSPRACGGSAALLTP